MFPTIVTTVTSTFFTVQVLYHKTIEKATRRTSVIVL